MGEGNLDNSYFKVRHIISSSTAAKQFDDVRRKAKECPQFVMIGGKVDSVLLDFEQYKKLCMEVEELRERVWELQIVLERKDDVANIPLTEVLKEEDFDFDEIMKLVDSIELEDD